MLNNNFGKGKAGLFVSMLALAGIEISLLERQHIAREVRRARSGFTSNPHSRKVRNRKRYQIAFESRRRNRK